MGFFNRNDAVEEAAESGRMRPDDLLGPKPDRSDGDKGNGAETATDPASTPDGTTGEDAAKARSAGFQMHMAKPVEPAALISSIMALARPAA